MLASESHYSVDLLSAEVEIVRGKGKKLSDLETIKFWKRLTGLYSSFLSLVCISRLPIYMRPNIYQLQLYHSLPSDSERINLDGEHHRQHPFGFQGLILSFQEIIIELRIYPIAATQQPWK